MLKYAFKRLLEMIPTTLGILLLTFVLFNVIGTSPAETVLGKNATAESIAEFNHRWGYDQPLHRQFVRYIVDLAHLDFGYSHENARPVAEVLEDGVLPSLELTVPILVGGVIVALLFGLIAAACRARAADRAILFFSTVLMSVNYVVWVILGQYFFSFRLALFPVWGFESAAYLLLPVAIGIFSGLGPDVRFFRTAVLDEIHKPYVLTARAKGLSAAAVLFRHVLPNALIPIVTYVSLSIPYLFTGSLLLESFFGIPGLGSVSINAIHSGDMAVVRAVVTLGALLYQCVNLAADLLYSALDPRLRL